MEEGNKLIVAISKGRVFEQLNNTLKDTTYSINQSEIESRKILLNSKTPEVKFLLVRGWDIPAFVHSGVAQLGIVGKDILLEREAVSYTHLTLPTTPYV